jgi:hypothetical protein
MRRSAIALVGGLLLVLPGAVRGEEAVTRDQFDALEQRNRDLELHNQDLEQRLDALEERDRERSRAEDDRDLGAPLAEWTRRIRLGGSANTGYYRGTDESPWQDTSFQVYDARLFLDADLGRDVSVGETPIARNLGFSFEWDIVRLGDFENQLGETYVELQGIGGKPWANAQVGRFQIPVGENYLRYSKGYRDNPFITNTVGGPWWWDEGIKIYGSGGEGKFGYVASITDGETDFETDSSREPQFTLKLWARPLPWLYASVSGLRSGQIGDDNGFSSGALWLGETWATPVGSMGPIPTWQNGHVVPDAPKQIDSTHLLGADVVLTPGRFGRIWLAAGRYTIDNAHSTSYDRNLWYWIAEWVIGGEIVSPELTPFYLALRADGLGTYDQDKGYLLQIYDVGRVGYNGQSLTAYSVALGWHLTHWCTLRLEYTHRRIDLVDGVPATIRNDAGDEDMFGAELGAAF